MPEGDTLFRTARTLEKALTGKVVTGFRTAYAQLAAVDDQSPIRGRTVESVKAIGKHLLIQFSGDAILHTHMRMNGSWHIYRPGEKWQRGETHVRVVVETADIIAVGFDIPIAEFLTQRALERHPDLARLGPDLLDDAVDVDEIVRRFRERAHLPMHEAILNQRVMAGAGNVFKSELLFLTAIHPQTRVAQVSDEQLRALIELGKKLLRVNVRPGAEDGIVTYTGMRRTTGRSNPGERLWVYGRRGSPCRKCGTHVELAYWGEQSRSTYWCPHCQPLATDQPARV